MVQYPLFGLKGKYPTGKPKPDNNITIDDGEILLLSLIDNLSSNKNRTQKTCSASNAYIVSVLNESERNVQRKLNKLKTIGLIKTFESKDKATNRTSERLIYIQGDTINQILKEKYEARGDNFGNDSNGGDRIGKESELGRQDWLEGVTGLVDRGDNFGKEGCQSCHPNKNSIITKKEQYNNSENEDFDIEDLMPF